MKTTIYNFKRSKGERKKVRKRETYKQVAVKREERKMAPGTDILSQG